MPNLNTPVSWVAGSTITLGRVGWDSWNVPHFANTTARDSWFQNRAQAESWPRWINSRFLRVSEPITVDLPYSQAYGYNYLIAENPAELGAQGGQPSRLFYFVTNSRPTSRGGTELTIELDIWTTRIHGVQFGRGYLLKGHALMADYNATRTANLPETLRKYYTMPEGLDAGADMVEIGKTFAHLDGVDEAHHWVIIVSTADLTVDAGTVQQPKLQTATGANFDGNLSGCNVYAAEMEYFKLTMAALGTRPWVSQNIVAMYTMPSGALNVDTDTVMGLFGTGSDPETLPAGWGLYPVETTTLVQTAGNIDLGYYAGNFTAGQSWAASLLKMRAFPYSCVVMETGNGQSLALKPQLLPATVTDLKFISCAMYPFARCGIYPEYYNAQQTGYYEYAYRSCEGEQTAKVPRGDYLATALWLSDFPQFSIVNNQYIVSIASRANAISATRQNAQAARSIAGEQAAIANAQGQRAIATEKANLEIGQEYGMLGTGLSAGVGVVQGTLGGGLIGGVSATLGGATQVAETVISQESARQQARNQWAQASANLGENARLAIDATNTSYESEMRSLNAGIADAALTPPSITAQMGGDGLALKMGNAFTVTIRYMRIPPQAVENIGTIWKRFGYVTNRYANLETTPLNLMSICTYWQLSEVYFDSADMNEGEKNALRGMLNRGLTVWNNPDRIGLDDIHGNVALNTGGVIFD